MGALIIEDRAALHGIPDQIADMPELVLTIQEMDPELSAADRDASGGELYNTTATQRCSTATLPVVQGFGSALGMSYSSTLPAGLLLGVSP